MGQFLLDIHDQSHHVNSDRISMKPSSTQNTMRIGCWAIKAKMRPWGRMKKSRGAGSGNNLVVEVPECDALEDNLKRRLIIDEAMVQLNKS
ncbi:hypothetical protein AVEN_174482-1 [Araneus ventricosus]|uniref:Uncharacterized protein n=1 Tax=Araneus ventricosus TaxID=182803 RepID=A0A4Y2UX90_ARAVE|nr:hypothetical protein AVEN_174482-1 [Araneus ventricosus]